MSEEYDRYEEECEHNRPFFECEICGNVRMPKMNEKEITNKKVKEGLEGIKQIIDNARAQRILLLSMLESTELKNIKVTLQQEILEVIDGYIEDKNITYRKEDNKSVITLKMINADNNSSLIIKLIDLDWI
ncbi:hypothetical protein LCGC14_2063220 [marine sediment metagenome]|uniref:Uncharacterized protein n=1 Tax=marine sediment metagenome TaxID=412755 RepID=A0A0F9GZ15_9ZZZZ